MNAVDLMRGWPQLAKLSAREILDSPAWHLQADFNGKMADILMAPEATVELLLSITLDDTPHVLGLSQSPIYSDLSKLWDRLDILPNELVIALVEKECSNVLQMLENVFRQEVKIIDVAKKAGPAKRYSFVTKSAGASFGFSIDLPAEIIGSFGILDNLDTNHPAIANMKREVIGEYFACDADAGRIASLKAGDRLLLPEDAGGKWLTSLPDDGALHVCLAEKREFSFSEFEQSALPELPGIAEGAPIVVVNRGAPVFSASLSKIGSAMALELKDLSSDVK